MSSGTQYVTAAYGVVLFALLVYAAVVGLRAARTGREAEVLARIVGEGTGADEIDGPTPRDPERAAAASGSG